MLIKQLVRRAIVALGRFPFFWALLHTPFFRYVLLHKLGLINLYRIGLSRPHPYDVENGIDTSGIASSSGPVDAHGYWGASPTVVRAALAQVPSSLDRFTFIDIGCGKGRPLFIASEFPFQKIIGVELSASLAEVASANARIMDQRFPGRPPVIVLVEDATLYVLPPGDLVIYLYNPFGEETMMHVVRAIETVLAEPAREIYVIYQNPVSAHCFDSCGALTRCYAGNIAYALNERGFRLDVVDVLDGVVIWHGGAHSAPASRGADAKVIVTELAYCKRARVAA